MTDRELVTSWGLLVEGAAAATRLLAAELKAGCELSLAEAEVLFRMVRSEPRLLTTSQLARDVSFSSGGFTRLADRLVSAGLVERRPCPSDRRVVYAQLTEVGRERAETALALHADGLRRHVLGSVGHERLAALGATMRLLRDHLSG